MMSNLSDYKKAAQEFANTQPDHIVDMHEMVTDTNQASELYELCREVYKRFPGWNNTLDGGYRWLLIRTGKYETFRLSDVDAYEGSGVIQDSWHNGVPLYTSDYLLEKLPPTIKNEFDGDDDYLILYKKSGSWYADYMSQFLRCKDDTPLKALLKLTIALSEAGELK